MIEENRKQWVDILKGILIIMVVLGHSYFEYSKYIYWFHMPVFFMLSGYVFHVPKINTFEWIKNILIKLMIPFCVWWISLSLLSGSFTFHRLLYMMWGGRLLGGVYWYINCLVLTRIVFLFLSKSNKKNQIFIIPVFYVVAILESNFLNQFRTPQGLPTVFCFPWNVDVVLLATVYFFIGYYGDNIIRFLRKRISHVSVLYMIMISIIFGFLICDLTGISNFKIDMKTTDYSNLIFTVLVPTICFLMFKLLAEKIQRFRLMSTVLCNIGKVSLIIMYTHIYVRELIIKPILGDKYSICIYIIVSIIIGMLIFNFANKNKILGFLLLGKSYRHKSEHFSQ